MMSWLYRFVTDAISRRAAVVATILMGTNVFVLTYFHELRPYTFLILFSAAHLSVYWRVTHKRNVDRFTGFMFIATATALLYTHTFSVVLFVGIALFHLIFRPKILRWWQVVTGWGIGIAIFFPYLWGFANIARDLTERARPAFVADLIGVGAKVIVNGCEWLWIPLVISIGYAAWRTHNSSVTGLLVTTIGNDNSAGSDSAANWCVRGHPLAILVCRLARNCYPFRRWIDFIAAMARIHFALSGGLDHVRIRVCAN